GRLRPWVAGVPDQLSGASTLSAELRVGPGLVDGVISQLSMRDLRTRVGAISIDEPQLEAHGDFRWSAAEAAIQSTDLELATSTVAAKARGVSLRFSGAGPPTARGDIAFRGDLERLASWFGAGAAASATGQLVPRGQAVGRLQLTSDAQRATANLT